MAEQRDQSARLQMSFKESPAFRRWAAEAARTEHCFQQLVSTPPLIRTEFIQRDKLFGVTDLCGGAKLTNNEELARTFSILTEKKESYRTLLSEVNLHEKGKKAKW